MTRPVMSLGMIERAFNMNDVPLRLMVINQLEHGLYLHYVSS